MRQHFNKALQNIIKHGDTDIFPFPFERSLFEHDLDKTFNILESYYNNTAHALTIASPHNITAHSQVGYLGFREADLIDPLWNAFYLGLVISIAADIEKQRIHTDEQTIFSHRFAWDEEKAALFNHSGWFDYKKQCVANAKKYPLLLQTDIVNFYPNINHRQLAQDLSRIDPDNVAASRIMQLLQHFTHQLNFGLPVGGPASRILAELILNETDHQLKSRQIPFCRYADDFTLFCTDEADAYRKLILLTQILAKQQLSLHKDKTKIIKAKEYQDIHQYLEPKAPEKPDSEAQKIYQLNFRFNPYTTPDLDDPHSAHDEHDGVDIVAFLSREVKKTKIDLPLTKQAINAIKAVPITEQVQAIRILLDHVHSLTLSPVFTNSIRLVRRQYEKLPPEAQDFIDHALIRLFIIDHFLIRIDVNTSYLIQILSIRHTPEKETLLADLYTTCANPYIRRQIIVAMANWTCRAWLQDRMPHYPAMSSWEQRAFLYATHVLGAEGAQWRAQQTFSPEAHLLSEWFARLIQTNKTILV
jgi:hypothetical protein